MDFCSSQSNSSTAAAVFSRDANADRCCHPKSLCLTCRAGRKRLHQLTLPTDYEYLHARVSARIAGWWVSASPSDMSVLAPRAPGQMAGIRTGLFPARPPCAAVLLNKEQLARRDTRGRDQGHRLPRARSGRCRGRAVYCYGLRSRRTRNDSRRKVSTGFPGLWYGWTALFVLIACT
ncbi:hypothetical protein LX32DRAFT_295307 [Colletotrichum zoysiae]|uniref:Uncharacterized protein n=1 Tax=Colletotrichum zoysiae TaxID=1216348 RepID=A0AAD9HMP9_9PEZI|nr:hypothetical protein LX32DRAFT_295307 [Colletotrichum zoysiae]